MLTFIWYGFILLIVLIIFLFAISGGKTNKVSFWLAIFLTLVVILFIAAVVWFIGNLTVSH